MSNFCDQTTIEVHGGKGGDGAISFRKEKYVARGGPDGGDGGNGGNIIFSADININTLVNYSTKKLFKAEDGTKGSGTNSSGKTGQNMILKVPVGTLFYDSSTNELLADLKGHGQEFIAAKGGRGGLGNTNFKSSIHQAPKFAELGEEGESKRLKMELRLVADIGIVGYPSAGKSTLISVISNAKPKIADYPFTTLIPNLGVVNLKKYFKDVTDSFIVADIPGLIEGAHKGKGLGHQFLRHISRTDLIIHLIDPTRDNPKDYLTINNELAKFDKNLASKIQILAITKIDLFSPPELESYLSKFKKANPKLNQQILPISSVTGAGIKQLLAECITQLSSARQHKHDQILLEDTIESQKQHVLKPHLKLKKFEVSFKRVKTEAQSGKQRRTFDVSGARIEQVVKMTDFSNPEGIERVYHFMNKMGITAELRNLGAVAGDKIRIVDQNLIMR